MLCLQVGHLWELKEQECVCVCAHAQPRFVHPQHPTQRQFALKKKKKVHWTNKQQKEYNRYKVERLYSILEKSVNSLNGQKCGNGYVSEWHTVQLLKITSTSSKYLSGALQLTKKLHFAIHSLTQNYMDFVATLKCESDTAAISLKRPEDELGGLTNFDGKGWGGSTF